MRVGIPLDTNYESTRLPAVSQQTLNYYPHSLRGYRPYPGLVSFSDFLGETEALNDSSSNPILASDGALRTSVTPGGDDRGMKAMGGILYIVSGPSLFSVNVSGITSYLGAIANSPNPVVMDEDGTQLVITTGSTMYVYTASGGLSAVTDTDISTPWTNGYIDSRFIVDQPEDRFYVSDLNDATAYDALNFATAEATRDGLKRVFTYNQMAYMMGGETIEPWYTSGIGKPPLDRQSVISVGLAGRWAIDAISNTIYFIDNKMRPSVMEGAATKPIYTTSALGKEWGTYSKAAMESSRVNCYSIDEENFVDFIFPTISKCWTYHEASGKFFEKTFVTTSLIEIYGKLLAADATKGILYEVTDTANTNNGDAITFRKDSKMITSEVFGVNGKDLTLNTLTITFEASASATVSVYLSKDLTTFSNPRTFTLLAGNSKRTLTGFGKVHEGILRIEHSSDASVDVLDLAAEVDFIDA